MPGDEATEPPALAPLIPFEPGFEGLYGLEFVGGVRPDGSLRGRVRVGARLLTDEGVLHGGVPAAIAESLASQGTGAVVFPAGAVVSGLANDTTVTVAVGEGATLHAQATPLHRADDYWVWSVRQHDDAGTLCAFSRVTIAVRPPRPAAG